TRLALLTIQQIRPIMFYADNNYATPFPIHLFLTTHTIQSTTRHHYIATSSIILFGSKNTKGNNYQEVENNIKEKVISLFTEYSYLKQYLAEDNDIFVESQKRKLSKYLSGEFGKADLQNSLRFLSEILAKHFKQNVYILIDEYDEAINDSYVEFSHKSKEFKQVVELIREILGSALKDNPCLEKAVLTGIYRLAKANF